MENSRKVGDEEIVVSLLQGKFLSDLYRSVRDDCNIPKSVHNTSRYIPIMVITDDMAILCDRRINEGWIRLSSYFYIAKKKNTFKTLVTIVKNDN